MSDESPGEVWATLVRLVQAIDQASPLTAAFPMAEQELVDAVTAARNVIEEGGAFERLREDLAIAARVLALADDFDERFDNVDGPDNRTFHTAAQLLSYLLNGPSGTPETDT